MTLTLGFEAQPITAITAMTDNAAKTIFVTFVFILVLQKNIFSPLCGINIQMN
jgi:hypothetical protein